MYTVINYPGELDSLLDQAISTYAWWSYGPWFSKTFNVWPQHL